MVGVDGASYEGEWKDDKFNGKGTYKWANGRSYEGDWEDDKAHGKGTLKWADGRSYVGDFKDVFMHGQGIHTRPDKTVLTPVKGKGRFENDKMVGNFTETKPDGKTRIVVNPSW